MNLIDSTMARDAGRAPIRKSVGLRFALSLAILPLALVATGRVVAATAKSSVSRHDVEAKMQYCKDCHGPAAQGYRGFYPIPRLAGQQTEYLKNQLRAFVERRRPNNIMSNVAHVLTPAMITALAAKFRNLNPGPVGGAPRNRIAAGKEIFQDGVPGANVAACAACHGPDAKGDGKIPRLAGQLYPYVVKTLSNWGNERGQNPLKPDTSAIMEPVAHSLTKPQIEAVAAYVSYLR